MTHASMSKRFLAAVIALPLGVTAPAAAVTVTDTFDTFFDYSGFRGGPSGTVPAGGIWDGIFNATNGGDPAFAALPVLEANGANFDNTQPAPGQLLVEDLGGLPNTNGSFGMGWDQLRSSAPLLYVEVPAGGDFEAILQLGDQTAGTFSTAGIVTRIDGAPVGTTNGDGYLPDGTQVPFDAATTTRHHPDENFFAAYRSKQREDEPDFEQFLAKGVEDGVAFLDSAASIGGAVPEDFSFLRVVKVGEVISGFSSSDGVEWTLGNFARIPKFDDPTSTLQVGVTFGMTNNSATPAEARFDEFSLTTGEEFATGPAEWQTNATSAWQDGFWLSSDGIPVGSPNSNTEDALLGQSINAPRTVFSNEPITVRSLTFDSDDAYTVAGPGGLTLEADTGPAGLDAVQGTHSVQIAVGLGSDTTSNVAADARINLENALALNGNTLTVAGEGDLFVNNDIISGAAGAVVNDGRFGGIGTVNGDYTQGSTGVFVVELNADDFTGLEVVGAVALDGDLDVSLVDDFTASPGDVFTVLTGASVTGSLNLVGDAASSFSLSTTSTSVVLTAVAGSLLPGDYNGDGQVNAADYTVWRDALEDGEPLPNNEVTSPGVADIQDYLVWRDNFGEPSGAPVQATPEPNAAWLLLGAIGMLFVSWRSRMSQAARGFVAAAVFSIALLPAGASAQGVALSNAAVDTVPTPNPQFLDDGSDPQFTGTLTNSQGVNIDFLLNGITIDGDDDNVPNSLNRVTGTNNNSGLKFRDNEFVHSFFSVDSADPDQGSFGGSTVTESFSWDLSVTGVDGGAAEPITFVFGVQNIGAGNNASSQFTIDWGGTGEALVSDPEGQLTIDSNENGSITFSLSDELGFLANSAQTWAVLPEATTSLTFSFEEVPDQNATQQDRIAIRDFVVGPAVFGEGSWNVDGSETWFDGQNWLSQSGLQGFAPSGPEGVATLGDAISAVSSVFIDNPLQINTINLDNANTYALIGGGSLELAADTGTAAINVLNGSHEIQVPIDLTADLVIDAAAGSVLNINGALDLGGFSLTVTGGGEVNFNNGVIGGVPVVSGSSLVTVAGSVVAATPEPTSMLLVVAPAALLACRRARRR